MKFICFGMLTAVGSIVFLDGDETVWKCTIQFKNKEHTLRADESKRIKEMFGAYEKKSAATTDEKETVFHSPMATFRFSKSDSKVIRYLSFHHEEPFTIEVAIGDEKTRRVIHGDEKLLSKVKEINNNAFPKK
jgi:hypothetical protein